MEDLGTNRLKFLVKSQTLSFGLKNFSFSRYISTSFGVQSMLLLLWRFLKTENEKISFYTRDNTETNKRVKVNFFSSVNFLLFNKEFKIELEIFHLFIATNNLAKV